MEVKFTALDLKGAEDDIVDSIAESILCPAFGSGALGAPLSTVTVVHLNGIDD